MKATLLIAGHEWRRLWASPLAWTSLAVVQLIHALVFWLLLTDFATTGSPDGKTGVSELVGGGLFGFATIVLLLIVPLLSMRSVAEERAQGSLELLLAAPLSLPALVLGKFLGLLSFLTLMLAMAVLMPLSLAPGTPLDFGLLASGALGLFLLTAAFAAAGVCASVLAPQPVVAAVGSFGLLLLLWLLELVGQQAGLVGRIAAELSLLGHFDALRRGLLDSFDLAFYLLFATAFLLAAILRLEAELRQSVGPALWLNALLWLGLLIGLGVGAERHRSQIDLSAAGRNTLTPASQRLLTKLEGPVEATVFLSPDAELRRQLSARLDPYARAKADFHVSFVDPATQPQRVRELGIAASGELVLSYAGRREQLSSVSEASVSAALQRLSHAGQARLYALRGHGERDPADSGTAGISRYAEALAAKGLQLETLNLAAAAAVPADADALLILAPRQALLPGEIQILVEHVSGGGNLLWLTDPDSAAIGPLADALAVLPLTGTVILQDHELLGLSHPGLALVAEYPDHPVSRELDELSVFALAGGLDATPGGGWARSALLTSPERSWLETGPLDGAVSLDPGQDQRGPALMGLVQSRRHPDGVQQRVAVIADSDFLSNQYLDQLGNRRLAVNLAQWLARRDGQMNIDVPAAPDVRLQLAPWEVRLIGLVHALVLPLAFVLIGGALWWRRRR